jgi:hypothetical protein
VVGGGGERGRAHGSMAHRTVTLSNRFSIQLCRKLVGPPASPRLPVMEEDPLDLSYFE